jgi:very-short-patch-repair endonuclease
MHKLPIHIEFARDLRKRQTPEEKIIWSHARNRKMLGQKFLRQYPIITSEGFYIADFYCDAKKLVVEIDGGIHMHQVESDKHRNEVMQSLGLTVLRITNEEVNTDLNMVLKKIRTTLLNL